MTAEEAIEYLKQVDITVGKKIKTRTAEALEMAIRALEREPCEDAVSRQAIIDMTGLSEWFDSSDSYNDFVSEVYKIPSVNPQKWIPVSKIRAEIEPIRKMYLEMNDIDWLNGCDYVLQIIDKYIGESEE